MEPEQIARAICNAQFHYQNEKELQQGIAPRPPREVHGPVGDPLLSMQIDFPDTTRLPRKT